MFPLLRVAALLALAAVLPGIRACEWCCGGSTPRFYAIVASLDTLQRTYRVPLGEPEKNELGPSAGFADPDPVQTSRIDPLLESWLSDGSGTTIMPLIVSFRDTVTMPLFPEPDMSRPRDDSVNLAKRDTARMRIDEIRAARAAQYAADTALASAHGARVLDVFWIIQAALVEMPLDRVPGLAADPTVRYIEPEDGPRRAPSLDSSIALTVAEGIDQIHSEPFRALGLDYGWVGLIDSGVDDHSLFAVDGSIDGTRIASRQDFVIGETHEEDPANPDSDPDDPNDIYTGDGHGTATMSILNGRCGAGESCETRSALVGFQGVTDASVNSYRVYFYSGSTPYVCRSGVLKATQESLERLDRTFVVELDVTTGETSSLVSACNAAYDLQAAVIVAVGNQRGMGDAAEYVAAPACAHRVLSVAGYAVNETERTPEDQRHGPTTDDARVKPEVTAPTGTITASASGCADPGCTSVYYYYSGSSGATPYAAGVAVLWNNWLRATGGDAPPGLVYAFTIVSGRSTTLGDESGVGPIRMPSDGYAWYGSVEVDAGATQPIEVDIPWEDVYAIEAAIWWPEEEGGEHSYHELSIVDPDGHSVESGGDHVTSVFQRASAGDATHLDGWPSEVADGSDPLATGKWTVQIARASAPTYTQTVYYAIVARAASPPASGPLEAVIDEVDEGGTGDTGTGGGRGPLDLPCWLWWLILVLGGLAGGFAIYRFWRLKR